MSARLVEAASIAVSLQGGRQSLERAVAENRPGIETWRVELAGPGVISALRQLQLQLHHGRCAELEVELRLLAIAVCVKAAGIIRVADFPGERGLAVALVAFADGQPAIEVGVAVGRLQHQLAQFDAAVRPAAGQVEFVRSEQRQVIPRHLQGADVDAVEHQLDRWLQRHAAGTAAFVSRLGQRHIDAIGIQRQHVQPPGQERPEAQIKLRLRHLHHGALAVVVAHAGQFEWADQPAVCLLHVQCAVGRAFGPRQRKAQAGAGAEQPPQCRRHEQQQDGEGDGGALEPLHAVSVLRVSSCEWWRVCCSMDESFRFPFHHKSGPITTCNSMPWLRESWIGARSGVRP